MTLTPSDRETLAAIRESIRRESVSFGELATLQAMGEAGLIPADDVALREWAGLPEYPLDLWHAHNFTAARFTGAVTCTACGLMPFDDDDTEIPCTTARELALSVLIWARTPGDHGGNPYTLPMVREAAAIMEGNE